MNDNRKQAVKATSEELSRPMYQNLVNLLDSGDLDTQINTLTLINSLLQTAQGDDARKEAMDSLTSLGFFSILKVSPSSSSFCGSIIDNVKSSPSSEPHQYRTPSIQETAPVP